MAAENVTSMGALKETPFFSRRALVAASVALVVSAFCVGAGMWQFARHDARADAHAAYVEASRAPVVGIETAIDACATSDTNCAAWEYRTVIVTGSFDHGSETLLRNRRVDGVRAVHALVWFRLKSGESVLLDAGWRPADEPNPPSPSGDLIMTIPDDVMSFAVVLRAFEDDDGKRDDGATRIHPAQMPPPAGQTVPLYGVVVDPCSPDECPPYPATAVPVTEPTLGPHLAYAFQWWIFAVLAPIGVVMLLRRDRTHGGEETRAPAPPRRRRRAEPSDEEIEDAL